MCFPNGHGVTQDWTYLFEQRGIVNAAGILAFAIDKRFPLQEPANQCQNKQLCGSTNGELLL
jgi:hypothetical protein